jgi:hypothetical protein
VSRAPGAAVPCWTSYKVIDSVYKHMVRQTPHARRDRLPRAQSHNKLAVPAACTGAQAARDPQILQLPSWEPWAWRARCIPPPCALQQSGTTASGHHSTPFHVVPPGAWSPW